MKVSECYYFTQDLWSLLRIYNNNCIPIKIPIHQSTSTGDCLTFKCLTNSFPRSWSCFMANVTCKITFPSVCLNWSLGMSCKSPLQGKKTFCESRVYQLRYVLAKSCLVEELLNAHFIPILLFVFIAVSIKLIEVCGNSFQDGYAMTLFNKSTRMWW